MSELSSESLSRDSVIDSDRGFFISGSTARYLGSVPTITRTESPLFPNEPINEEIDFHRTRARVRFSEDKKPPRLVRDRDLVTPGYLEALPACGEVRAKVVCPTNEDHHKEDIPHTCGAPGCVECWRTWAGRETTRVSQVVEGYRSATGTHQRPFHVSMGPRPEDVPFTAPTNEALAWLLEWGNNRYTELGMVAAAVIPHPYRIVKEKKKFVNEQVLRFNRGKKQRDRVDRYRWCLLQDNWRDYLYFSPHLHVFGYGWLPKPDIYLTAFVGVYRNHGRIPASELEGAIAYALGHSWVKGNHKTVRYYRGMSTRHLGCVTNKHRDFVQCEACGEYLRKVRFADNIQNVYEAEFYERVIIDRAFFIRLPWSGTAHWERFSWRRFWSDAGGRVFVVKRPWAGIVRWKDFTCPWFWKKVVLE